MGNFDLKKYLANNPLLNEGLSSQEQDIVNDILKGMDLNIEESMLDVGKKMKQYAKKGLLSAAIVASVCGMVSCENNDEAISAINIEMSILDGDIKDEEFNVTFYLKAAQEYSDTPGATYSGLILRKTKWEEAIEKVKELKKEKTQLLIQLA